MSTIEWTRAAGDPLAVSLVQGNIEQERKFDPAYRDNTLAIYADLAQRAMGRLIVLPESALPMFAEDVPEEIFARFERTGRARGGDVLVGMFTLQPPLPGSDETRRSDPFATSRGGVFDLVDNARTFRWDPMLF